MNKLISANYWFGCDWVFYEVGYLGLRAGQLSLACAVVYLWNTGYLRGNRPRSGPAIQQIRLSQDVREPTKHHDMSRHVTDMSHETYLHARRPKYPTIYERSIVKKFV